MMNPEAQDKRPMVLIADDMPGNLAELDSALRDFYTVRTAGGGAEAVGIATSDNPPDLILLDLLMPDMDGFEVCRRLKADPKTAGIPVIFVTDGSNVEEERNGLEVGAADFVVRPVSPPILLARVRNHILLKSAGDFLRGREAYVEKEVTFRTMDTALIQDVTMVAMGSLAEARDNETGNHIRRTQQYIKDLVEKLRNLTRFREVLADDENNELLFKSAPLHDIGKVGIPDRILLKPGKLTPEEFEIMKTHTTIGRDAILSAERLLSTPSSFLRFAREISYSHHEKWDGTGYPRRLKGEKIPLSARLMAVADVYDALISHRPYRPPFPHEKAVEVLLAGKGIDFDPDIIGAFVEIQDRCHATAMKFADSEEAVHAAYMLKNAF